MLPPITLRPGRALLACALTVAVLAIEARAADVIISEVLASNTYGITDEDGEDSDWIELSNVSGASVDLGGWFLTDDAAQLDKWEFPSTTLNAGAELLVFASDKDRALAGEELHTNFKLAAGGEYLALVRPDGITVEYAFDPYPQQFPDVSYGSGTPGGTTVQLVGPEDPVRFKVPVDGSEDTGGTNPWNAVSFDDSSWALGGLGVGFANAGGDDPYFEFIGAGSDVQAIFFGQNTSIYMRVPFTISDPAEVASLAFSARYDDGFAVYINGSEVLASANLPGDGVLDWDASPSRSHSDTLAVALEPFTIDLEKVALVAGTNVLAIHGLNLGASSSDFLFDCELEAQVTPAAGGTALVYMPPPTPGGKRRLRSAPTRY